MTDALYEQITKILYGLREKINSQGFFPKFLEDGSGYTTCDCVHLFLDDLSEEQVAKISEMSQITADELMAWTKKDHEVAKEHRRLSGFLPRRIDYVRHWHE